MAETPLKEEERTIWPLQTYSLMKSLSKTNIEIAAKCETMEQKIADLDLSVKEMKAAFTNADHGLFLE